MQKRSLGRGLSDLLSGTNAMSTRAIIEVETEKLQPNPLQPRRSIDYERLGDLTNTIRDQGILQPILVREAAEGYQIVAGERRWRAAGLLNMPTVPCIVTDLDDFQALEVALIENLQRDDLNPIDEARAYRRLNEEFGVSQEELGGRLGKSRSAVANCMRLLTLPLEVQDAVCEGTLTEGHARALLTLREQPALLYQACQDAISRGLNVRDTEEMARNYSAQGSARAPEPAPAAALDPHMSAVQERLQAALATKVALAPRPDGGGTIRISYHDVEELSRLLDAIAPEMDF